MDTPVTGTPRLLLRVEGVVVLITAVMSYRALGASWTMFAIMLLAPDVALLGYVAGPRVGAHLYNALHTYMGPALLATVAMRSDAMTLWALCAIWMAHIGMDRTLGLGLKFERAFQFTHLGTVGRAAPAPRRPAPA